MFQLLPIQEGAFWYMVKNQITLQAQISFDGNEFTKVAWASNK